MGPLSLMRNIGAYVKSTVGVPPLSDAGSTVNGAAIDRYQSGGATSEQIFESCVLHLAVGAVTGSPTSFTSNAKLQDSADGSTGWNDIPNAAVTELTAINTEAEVDVRLTGGDPVERYIRVVSVVAFVGGTSPELARAATVTLGGGVTTPV